MWLEYGSCADVRLRASYAQARSDIFLYLTRSVNSDSEESAVVRPRTSHTFILVPMKKLSSLESSSREAIGAAESAARAATGAAASLEPHTAARASALAAANAAAASYERAVQLQQDVVDVLGAGARRIRQPASVEQQLEAERRRSAQLERALQRLRAEKNAEVEKARAHTQTHRSPHPAPTSGASPLSTDTR